MRRSNCAGALQYVPELTWILFLRILDEREQQEAEEAEAVGEDFQPSLESPYRWEDWACPAGTKRLELRMGEFGGFLTFVNTDLIPHLRKLKNQPNATPRQKIISEVMSGVERVRLDTEFNLLNVLDKVHEISQIDPTHIFPISQVYEGLLLKMGEKNGDGGQFFTPREIVRAMIQAINPQINEKIYDPACGTGGFLAQAYEYMRAALGDEITGEQLETLKLRTFYGREKENLIYPIALANLGLHGVDQPNLWHGNTLTGGANYADLFQGAPALFDVILTNPPFGGKEHKEVQAQFAYKTSATQVLFLQHVINSLKPGVGVALSSMKGCCSALTKPPLSRLNASCWMTATSGVSSAYHQERLPQRVGAFKANILFFTRGKSTEKIWYYDLSDIKVGKKTPLTLAHFKEFLELLPQRADSDRSWTVTREEIEAKNYDLKAVNPNAKTEEDARTPGELLDFIEMKGLEVASSLAVLRKWEK
jgi:type I restriction enzyme M protein